MVTPKSYISYSSLILLEKNPEEWKEKYFYGKKTPINKGMGFGKITATALERDELTGNILLDIALANVPAFELRDKIIEDPNGVDTICYDYETGEFRNYKLPYVRDGKNKIPIMIKPDSTKEDLTGIKEYKTAQEQWSRAKIETNEQLTFYATGIFLITNKIPHDISLVQIPTKADENGTINVAGEILEIKTTRTISQILNMIVRIKKAWRLIEKMAEEELL